jgi:hypothetical protein
MLTAQVSSTLVTEINHIRVKCHQVTGSTVAWVRFGY